MSSKKPERPIAIPRAAKPGGANGGTNAGNIEGHEGAHDADHLDGEERVNWFRLGYLVHDVARMRRTLWDQQLKPLGITRSQWWVLANISRQPGEGVVSSVLSRDMDIGKVTLSGIVDRLEVAGYVYRRGDKKDKRAKRIYITELGYRLIEQMRSIIEPLNMNICEGMDEDEIRATEDGLAKVKANLKRMLGET